MKGVFIRNITHEINTPLNAIVGFAELASTAPDERARAQFLHRHHPREQRLPAKTHRRRALHLRHRIVRSTAVVRRGRGRHLLPPVYRRAVEARPARHRNPLRPQRRRPVAPHPHLVSAAEQGTHRVARNAVPGSPTPKRASGSPIRSRRTDAASPSQSRTQVPACPKERASASSNASSSSTRSTKDWDSSGRLPPDRPHAGGDARLDPECTRGARFLLTIPVE